MSVPMRVLWLMAVAACAKDGAQELGREPPRPSGSRIRYAATTEASVRQTNDTFFNIVEDDQLFIVADAVGPRGEGDPAKAAAEGVARSFATTCRPSEVTTDGTVEERQLTCALRQTSATLAGAQAGTTSIAAVLVRDDRALVAVAGEVVVVQVHDGVADVLGGTTAPNQPLGTSDTQQVGARWLDLAVGDTVAIVNRDLFDAVGRLGIQRAIAGPIVDQAAAERLVRALIDEAKRVPDHDALSVIVLRVAAASR